MTNHMPAEEYMTPEERAVVNDPATLAAYDQHTVLHHDLSGIAAHAETLRVQGDDARFVDHLRDLTSRIESLDPATTTSLLLFAYSDIAKYAVFTGGRVL